MERLIGPAEPEPSALSAVKETIDEWRFPVTGMMMPNARKALRTVMKQETMRQLAVAALAIARYQLKYERLPESLQQLIPEFLDTMPPDYMDGRPLRYKRNARSDWTLYSVGFNGIDDGGDPIGTTNSTQIWQGRDVVWPRADTKE